MKIIAQVKTGTYLVEAERHELKRVAGDPYMQDADIHVGKEIDVGEVWRLINHWIDAGSGFDTAIENAKVMLRHMEIARAFISLASKERSET